MQCSTSNTSLCNALPQSCRLKARRICLNTIDNRRCSKLRNPPIFNNPSNFTSLPRRNPFQRHRPSLIQIFNECRTRPRIKLHQLFPTKVPNLSILRITSSSSSHHFLRAKLPPYHNSRGHTPSPSPVHRTRRARNGNCPTFLPTRLP